MDYGDGEWLLHKIKRRERERVRESDKKGGREINKKN